MATLSKLPCILPIELWLQIFRWATLSPSTPGFCTIKYRPFEVVDFHGLDDSTATKRALVLVCKRWRNWATPLLYEDVLLPRERNPLNHMHRYDDEDDNDTSIPTYMVHRVHLPYSSTTVTSPKPIEPVQLLAQCPAVEVLVRTADPFGSVEYEFDTDCPPLPNLKRLDWWHNNEAARTGGINSLPHVLVQAPNLQYLSIGGELWPSYLHGPPVHLPELTTLRLRRANAFLVLQLCRWDLPALSHIVFDHAQAGQLFEPLWDAFGPQMRTVELGVSLKFYVADFLAFVFAGCPHLEELNYYVHFTVTHIPRVGRPQAALRTIGLHAQANSFYAADSPESWEHLERHFAAFTEEHFPVLQRVKLYGHEWDALVENKAFERLAEPLRKRGCTIEIVSP
ncbi:hypothetical protein C2E23DRAFT_865764 [Lenzites betulinus]|nr:hypothetical protein C2E23DRAFT_865764 [Lenzites betulinus]